MDGNDDGDTSCICPRCTMRRRKQDFRRNGCLKKETLVLLLATLVCTGFLNGHQCDVCPLQLRHVLRRRGIKGTPRAKPYKLPKYVGRSKLQKLHS